MPDQSFAGDKLSSVSESPRHGFQGDRGAVAAGPKLPAALTIAISREAGARGSSIAQRAGAKLGWQVYPQELLEYVSQEGNFRQDMVENLSPEARQWVEGQLQRLEQGDVLRRNSSLRDLARIVFALAAPGEVVLIGRGAGLMLPRASTLHVRLMAPLQDRVAYMGQWLRMTVDEAAEEVKQRDQRRAEFIETHFLRSPADPHQYDLVLNTSYLGEELCADLIVRAAQAKLPSFRPLTDPDMRLD